MDYCGVVFGLAVFGIVYLMSKHPEAFRGSLADIFKRFGGEPQTPAKPEGEKDDGGKT